MTPPLCLRVGTVAAVLVLDALEGRQSAGLGAGFNDHVKDPCSNLTGQLHEREDGGRRAICNTGVSYIIDFSMLMS